VETGSQRTDSTSRIVVACNQYDGGVGIGAYRRQKFGKPTDCALGRVGSVENVTRDNHDVRTMIIDDRENLSQNMIVVFFQGQTMELTAQMPITCVQVVSVLRELVSTGRDDPLEGYLQATSTFHSARAAERRVL
jgi:hypothetical protein